MDIRKGVNVHVQESHGLQFKCKILDIKKSYGNIRYLVQPLHGEGTAWVEKVQEIKRAPY